MLKVTEGYILTHLMITEEGPDKFIYLDMLEEVKEARNIISNKRCEQLACDLINEYDIDVNQDGLAMFIKKHIE